MILSSAVKNLFSINLLRIEHKFKYAFIIFLMASLSACASLQQSASSDIKKPKTDPRDYKSLVLDNGLKVLLISDPDTNQAAASMNVAVGSGHDPQSRQGLAHFLEHMLFLGTDKYPDAGEYQRFISTYGGNNNAYTSYEDTNYFFDIDEAYLEPALDRFSQFFIAPKFDEVFLEREKKAVDSEFSLGLEDDSRRSIDAIKSVINPAHPFSKFSTGNLLTLADRKESNIRTEIVDFYHKYYFAKNMSLVVYGHQSITDLQKMVTEKFVAIPQDAQKDLDSDDEPHITQEPLFLENSLPSKLHVTSIKDINSLSLMFPVPDDSENYQTNPYYFIAHLLGYEGQGSLLSELKRLGWAESLSAGGGISFNNGALFPINISLTAEGQKHVDDIIVLFFQAVLEIKNKGLTEPLYDEQRQISRVSFDYRETGRPYDYVSSLSKSLQEYSLSEVLYGPYMMEVYDQSLLEDMLSYIRPDNLLALVMSQKEPADVKTSWYQAPYSFERIKPSTLSTWQKASANKNLAVPELNPYLVNDFNLVQRSSASSEVVQIKDTDKLKVWQLANNLSDLPKANVFLRFKTPLAAQSAENAVLNGLYASLINDVINEESYDAYLTGLTLYFENHMRGINMRVSGFNEKQQTLIESVLKQIRLPSMDESRFKSIKQEYQLALKNSQLNKPYIRAYDLFQTMMQKPHFADDDLESALQSVTSKDLEAYIKRFWLQTSVEMFVNGNMSQKQALSIAGLVEKNIENANIDHSKLALVSLPIEQQPKLWFAYSQQSDTAYLRYVQGDNRSMKERAYFMLTGQMVQALFYYQLRTEQQLGYLVNASYFSNMGVPGLAFIVQSNKASPELLNKAVDLFLDHANERFVNKMLVDEFEKNKASVRAKLLTPPSSLLQQSDYYWSRIAADEEFDLNEQLAKTIQNISFDEWKAFFAQRFSKDKAQRTMRFSTQNFPLSDKDKKAMADWKEQQALYWVPEERAQEKSPDVILEKAQDKIQEVIDESTIKTQVPIESPEVQTPELNTP